MVDLAPSTSSRLGSAHGSRLWLRRNMALAAVVWVVAWMPFYMQLVHGNRLAGADDLNDHLMLARDFSFWPFHPTAPHLLFHVLTRGVDAIGPWGLAVSSVVVLSASGAVAGALLALLMSRLLPERSGSSWMPALGAMVVLLTNSPVALVAPPVIGVGGYVPFHLPFNPTTVVAYPFVLASIPVYLWFLDRRSRGDRSWRPAASVVAFVVLAMLAKPTVSLLAVVAVPVVAALWRQTGRVPTTWGRASDLAWPILPAIAVAVVQVWFIEDGPNVERRGGIEIDVFGSLRLLGRWPILYVGLVLLPIVVAWSRPAALRARSTQLAAALAAVGVAQFLGLRETGQRANGGAFGFAMHASIGLLVAFAVAWGLPVATGALPSRRGARGAVVAIMSLGMLAGVYGYGRWLL